MFDERTTELHLKALRIENHKSFEDFMAGYEPELGMTANEASVEHFFMMTDMFSFFFDSHFGFILKRVN